MRHILGIGLQKNIIKYLVPFLLFAFFSSNYLRFIPHLAITYWDEYPRIGESYFFELFIKRDFSNPLWFSYYGYDQPKLISYIFGAILFPEYLSYSREKENYDFVKFLIDHNFYRAQGFYQNYISNNPNYTEWTVGEYGRSSWIKGERGNADYYLKKYGESFNKVIKLIYKVRALNSFILAFCVVVTYFISAFLQGRNFAILATVLYGFNGLVIRTSLLAQQEAVLILLFNLGVGLLLIIFSKQKYSLKLLISYALISALCAQTKLNGILLIIIFNYLFILLLISLINEQRKRHSLIYYINNISKIFLVNLSFFIIFVALNPYLYKSPINNTLNMYNHRKLTAQAQTVLFPGSALPSYQSRFFAIYDNFLGHRINSFNNLVFLGTNQGVTLPWLWAFFLIGLIKCVYVFLKKRSEFLNGNGVMLISFILVQVVMIGYLELNWDRYFVQLAIFFIYFQTLGLYLVGKILFHYLLRIIKGLATRLFRFVTNTRWGSK